MANKWRRVASVALANRQSVKPHRMGHNKPVDIQYVGKRDDVDYTLASQLARYREEYIKVKPEGSDKSLEEFIHNALSVGRGNRVLLATAQHLGLKPQNKSRGHLNKLLRAYARGED